MSTVYTADIIKWELWHLS